MKAVVSAGPLTKKRTKLSPALSRVAALLALSIFINYIDRGSLSVAAPLVKDELGLTAAQLGVLLSSFFWTYAAFQIVSGWLVDRFDVNRVLALGILVWSAATFGSAFAHGFATLLALRLVLGMGESVAYPSYSKIIARHFMEEQRGRVNSLIALGYASGPAVGTFLGGMLMARAGWRVFFGVLGVLSALWLVPWFAWMRLQARAYESASRGLNAAGTPAGAEHRAAAGIPEILAQRSAWGTFAGLFTYNYIWYFLLTWLPYYLVRERHFSLQTMSVVGGAAFLGVGVCAVASGWASDRWIAAGASPTRVRKTFTAAGPAIASSIVLVSVVQDSRIAMAILVLAAAALGMCASNLWAVTQTLAGPETAGKWTGLQNFVGNLAGVVAPALTGLVVERTGHFFWAFALAAGVSVIGALTWLFGIGELREVQWSLGVDNKVASASKFL